MATQTSSTSYAPWLETAYQDLLSRAGSASQQPYQPYVDAQGNAIPRVAGFTPDQLAAFQRVRNAQGAQNPTFDQAQALIAGSAGQGGLSAANPYLQAAGSYSAAGQATPWLTQAGQMSSVGSAAPFLGEAAHTSAAAAASPLLQQGTGSWLDNSAAYMSPYTQQVTDRIAQLGARNLSENLLPQVNKTFIGSGQFGGSRNADFTNRALRDTQESVLGQQAQALESGYGTAANIYNQDAARKLSGAQTLGSLTGEDAARKLQAGTALGNFTNADAGRLAQIGQITGQLSAGDLDRQTQMANIAGGLGAGDAARQQQAGTALGNLATARQGAGYTDTSALSGIGGLQQSLNQQGLNTAYTDFTNQNAYDKNNLSWLSSILSGSARPTTTTTNQSSSVGSQILGGLTSGIGALGATGAFGDSGWLSGLFAEGGRVKLAEGGLAKGAVDYKTLPAELLMEAAKQGDLAALREMNRRQNPDRPGYAERAGTKGQPYEEGFVKKTLAPAASGALSSLADVATSPVSERPGLLPSLATMREPDYSSFSGGYPGMDELSKGVPPDYSSFSGAYPGMDELIARDPYMAMTPQQQVAQDIAEEPALRRGGDGGLSVGRTPGPTVGNDAQPTPGPMGGLVPPRKPAPPQGGGGTDWGSGNPLWTALMAGGAGAMSSKSSNVLGGIGEGLATGLNAYAQQRKADQQAALLGQQTDMERDRLALAQGREEREAQNAQRLASSDAARLGYEGRRVDLAEAREKRDAANDLMALSGAGKVLPAQAGTIEYLVRNGMPRDAATELAFGAKSDPLDRAKLVSSLAKMALDSGEADNATTALKWAQSQADQLAPARNAKSAGNSGVRVGQRATNGSQVLEWNGQSWVKVSG